MDRYLMFFGKKRKVYQSTRVFCLINLLYNALMIFYSLAPSALVCIISLAMFIYDYWYLRKKYDRSFALFLISILFLPISFVSVIGTSFSSFPVTYFSLSLGIIFINMILERKIARSYLVATICFVIFFIVSFLVLGSELSSAISQFVTILLFLFIAIQEGEFIKSKSDGRVDLKTMQNFYICAVLAFAFQIILQCGWFLVTKEGIGLFSMFSSRIAYAGLMGDFSFASLFLASGAMIMLIKYIVYKDVNFSIFIILTLFFLCVSALASARTGIVSFALCSIPFLIFNIKKSQKRVLTVLIPLILFTPVAIAILAMSRGDNGLFGGSGRIELIESAFMIIKEHPFLGVGFGAKAVADYGLILPHNFFIQYLLQFGIIGLTIVMSVVVLFISRCCKGNTFFWMFILIAIGAMFVPDIVSSRFLSIAIIMTALSDNKIKPQHRDKQRKDDQSKKYNVGLSSKWRRRAHDKHVCAINYPGYD